MAVFNPDVQPVQEQTFNNYFHPVDKTPVDKRGELLGQGIGQELGDIGKIIPQASTLTKDLIEKDASEKIFQQADAESDKRIQSLEATAQVLSPQPQKQTGEDITGATGDTKPPAISEAPGYVDNLVNLRNNGKISETEYKKRLYLFAKQTRAAYGPQFRDFIDNTISKATGEANPANAYAQSLIGDINARASKENDGRNAVASKLLDASNEGIPGAETLRKGVLDGSVDQFTAQKWIADRKAGKYASDSARWNLDTSNAERSIKEQGASDWLTKHSSTLATNYFSNLNTLTGVAGPEDSQKRLQMLASGQITASEEEIRTLGTLMDQHQKIAFAQAWKDANSPGPAGGPSIVQLMGADKAKKIIQDNLSPLFDNVKDSIYNKDWGAAYNSIHTSEAMKNEATLRVLRDTTQGAALATMGAVKSITGNDILTQDLTKQWIVQLGGSEKWTEFLKNSTAHAIVDNSNPKIWQSGKGPSLKEDVERAEQNDAPPITYQQVTQLPGQIISGKTSDQSKIALARYAFGPKNSGLISKFAKDTEVNDSQYSLYHSLFREDITKELSRLKGTGGDGMQAWQMYKNSAERTFGTELFRKDLANLRNFPGSKAGISIGWNDEKHRIEVNDIAPPTSDPYIQRERERRLKNLTKVTERINSGIEPLKGIYEAEGKDVNQYLIQELQQNNVDVSGWTGLPRAIADSILDQQRNAEQAKERMRKKKPSGN